MIENTGGIVSLSTDEINRIREEIIQRLGRDADPELIQQITNRVIQKLEKKENKTVRSLNFNDVTLPGTRIIISAMGVNKPGIVARIASAIAEYNGDIQDISQRILQEFFVMIMIVNIDHLSTSYNTFKQALEAVAQELGIKIFVQHEEIFRAVNRI